MHELVNRKKYLPLTSTYFCSINFDYAKEKGSIATKRASKPEKAVTKTILY